MSIRARFVLSPILLLAFLPLLAGAQSIFDDENWDDPSIESEPAELEREPAPPAVKPKPKPVAKRPVQDEPSDAPEPTEESEPDEPPAAAEPQRRTPEEVIENVTEKIKGSGRLRTKLEDPEVIHLFHQKAVAHARLGQFEPAREAMAKVLAAKLTNRSIVLNAAKLDIVSKTDAMRAATNLQRHMKANPEDDEALGLWGVALATVVKNKRRLPDLKVKQYLEAQTLLEKSRPGYRRWGVEWIDDARWVRMEQQREQVMRAVTQYEQRLRQEIRNYESIKRIYGGRKVRGPGGIFEPDPEAQAYVAQAEDRVAAVKRELAATQSRFPRPKWVMAMRMTDPDPRMEPKTASSAKAPKTAPSARAKGL